MQERHVVALDPTTFAIAALGVFIIAFTKGAFGGGFASIGIPLLSLVMDPLSAGALLAPLFVVMDLFALRNFTSATWSKPDLTALVPGLLVGVGVGYLALRLLDPNAVSIVMALITLTFVGLWLRSGGTAIVQPRSATKGAVAGMASGITTMVAHAGGPPLAMYLLPRGLPKQIYAGTTNLVFTVANAVKVVPWLLLVRPSSSLWTLMVLCLPVVPFGVWAGWKLHQRLDQRQMYRACYALLIVTALKLLWDGVTGYMK
jgi:uncharacterized protein